MSRMQTLGTTDYTQVMGILNVTPDSFSDGGRYTTLEEAVARAGAIDEVGADIIDVGGESTRPGADPVSVQEELERVLPVIEQITADPDIDALVSIDTYEPDVAEAALAAGADIVNDQNGLDNPEMQSLVATHGCKAVLMDAVNLPVDAGYNPKSDDIVVDVYERLQDRVERARVAGVSDDQLIIDPGIGFATGAEDDLELLARTGEFVDLGFPVLVGASRKSFTTEFVDLQPNERVAPSLAAHLVAAENGANIVRVHDVAETVAALRTAEALWSRQRTQ
ncbi:dihydropteroate synthase [Halogranum amylolyticum]|uniref:dihydropteroate synthase n=1 Tax=Halogranum amylolyticum TaxID=660520 RepID=A0A1H8UBY1_9EURY|nr:dihydropteroate synthase [Halogranum amylolyticum]SEP00606.1 dihydropteroate synthase [Halogranum amylolyticum]